MMSFRGALRREIFPKTKISPFGRNDKTAAALLGGQNDPS